jgi:ferric-dicitrate binding protein FerR (iron transport regulator)
MILPDNTMIYLNAGSEIRYSINGKNGIREVFLTGEAWFQVTKNNKKPFVVHTPYYHINVTGTEFNVKAYTEDNEITTTLETGAVLITSAENFKIQNNQVLKPGEQLVYNKEKNSIEIKKVRTNYFTAWKDNKLIFINMKLKELIQLLERKYGVDIEVNDESILDFHYDGTIRNETILEVMEILKHSLPIDYKIEEQKLYIIIKK